MAVEIDFPAETAEAVRADAFQAESSAGLSGFQANFNSSTARRADWPVEIDARDLVNRLRNREFGELDPELDFSLECELDSVEPSRQRAIEIAECPVCGNPWVRPRFAIRRAGLGLVDCLECGLGRLHPHPDAATITRFYPPDYYGVPGAKFVPIVERLVRLVAARQARALSRGLRPGARVLDVGCGRGVLLSALADRGFESHGFEISEAAAAGTDPRADVRIGGSLEEIGYPDGCFDQIILWHVLEHLPNPRQTLMEIRRILKPGGRLVVSVPNYSSRQARWSGSAWFHLDLPRHLFHFPVETLRRLLEELGFDRRSERHLSLRQNPFGWVQSALNRLRFLPRNGLYTLLKSRGDSSLPFTPALRSVFRLAYWLGMPLAATLSVVDALCRQGASVCILAETRHD